MKFNRTINTVSNVRQTREITDINLSISMSTPYYKAVNDVMCKTLEKSLRKVLEGSVILTIDKACGTMDALKKIQKRRKNDITR